MSKVIITTDSPADLPQELKERYGIKVIPLHVILDGEDRLDGVSVSADEIFDKFNEKKTLPSTSAISVAEYEDFFNGLTADGSEVVHIALSSKVSSTCQNARIAAQGIDGVFVVDSQLLSSGISLLCCKAASLAAEGIGGSEIAGSINEMRDRVQVSFVLDTLVYMAKGGRCSAVAALGANLLGLRPCIEMKDGGLSVCKKYRGKIEKVQLDYAAERLEAAQKPDRSLAFITHSGISEAQIKALTELVKKSGKFDEVIVNRAGCTISSHCGPNCMGILFIQ